MVHSQAINFQRCDRRRPPSQIGERVRIGGKQSTGQRVAANRRTRPAHRVPVTGTNVGQASSVDATGRLQRKNLSGCATVANSVLRIHRHPRWSQHHTDTACPVVNRCHARKISNDRSAGHVARLSHRPDPANHRPEWSDLRNRSTCVDCSDARNASGANRTTTTAA